MSTATDVITGICAYIQFKYALFREDTSQDFTFVGVGIAKGLSSDTLKVVEVAAREFIESLKSWDASTMSAYISIYEVLNLCLRVKSIADVW